MGHVARVRRSPVRNGISPGQVVIYRGEASGDNYQRRFGIVLATLPDITHIVLSQGDLLELPNGDLDNEVVVTDIHDPVVASGEFSMSKLVEAAKSGKIPSLALDELPCPASASGTGRIQVHAGFWFRFYRRRWGQTTLTWAEFQAATDRRGEWRMIRYPWPALNWPVAELVAAAESESLRAPERCCSEA